MVRVVVLLHIMTRQADIYQERAADQDGHSTYTYAEGTTKFQSEVVALELAGDPVPSSRYSQLSDDLTVRAVSFKGNFS